MRIAVSLIAGFLIMAPDAAHAQQPTTLLAAPPRFESWQPVGMPSARISATVDRRAAAGRPRGRNALIGAAIGTVAGLGFCTVISNLANDPGTGFSTCTLKGYLLTGGVGFGLGLLVGLTV